MELVRRNRDLRVDFFRGVALWFILLDHIPGDVLNAFTLRNYVLNDATEVFVLLAGFAAGLTYGRTQDRHGWLFAAADVMKRVWLLYVAHIFLFVVFASQVGYAAAALDKASYLEEIGLDPLSQAPYRALLDALTLRYQPAYLNVLPMYIAIMAGFAFALPLLRRPAVLAVCSFALYVAARSFGWNLPTWRGGGWFFNPLTWQFLFVLGVLMGRGHLHLPTRLDRRWVDALAVLLLLIGAAILLVTWHRPDLRVHVPLPIARVILRIDKGGMHPFRLISILALTWLTVRLVPAGARWVNAPAASPLVLVGQHGLPVFCSGIFLAFLGRLALERWGGWPMQILINAAGAAGLLGVAALGAWYRAKGAETKPRGPVAARPGGG
ncbi:MAG TPA: OpgC domain-containing protein [Acetobacteraceae bacterium]|nr:OpgC domain-containing protein [Acetobacteraceae bacterium]